MVLIASEVLKMPKPADYAVLCGDAVGTTLKRIRANVAVAVIGAEDSVLQISFLSDESVHDR